MSGLAAEHQRIDLGCRSRTPRRTSSRRPATASRRSSRGSAAGPPRPGAHPLRLLPAARAGPLSRGHRRRRRRPCLGVVEERVRRGQTGAQWALGSLAAMAGRGTPELRKPRPSAPPMLARQQEEAQGGGAGGAPVHAWEPAALEDDLNLVRDILDRWASSCRPICSRCVPPTSSISPRASWTGGTCATSRSRTSRAGSSASSPPRAAPARRPRRRGGAQRLRATRSGVDHAGPTP